MKSAVLKDPSYFSFASSSLKNNPVFVLFVVKLDGNIIPYTSTNIRKNKEIMKIAIIKNVLNLRYVAKELFDNNSFIDEIIHEKPSSYSLLPHYIRNRKDIIFKCLESYIYNFYYIPRSYKYDFRFILLVLKKNPTSLVLPSVMIQKLNFYDNFKTFCSCGIL